MRDAVVIPVCTVWTVLFLDCCIFQVCLGNQLIRTCFKVLTHPEIFLFIIFNFVGNEILGLTTENTFVMQNI